jgi:hypothetical protein
MASNKLLTHGSSTLQSLSNLLVSASPNVIIAFFILKTSSTTAHLLLYIDDIILTANTPRFSSHTISKLCSEFGMSDLGPLRHFLGIQVTPSVTGLILSQKQYALDILDHANMAHCNPWGVANALAGICWLHQLMTEFYHPPRHAVVVYCDNVSTIYLASNPIQHQRTKHMEIDLHFVFLCVSKYL